jgi:hypothetical protein
MNRMTTKNVLLTATLCAAIAVSIIGADMARGLIASAQSADDRDAVVSALRRGGLREAAKLKGHYGFDFDPHWDFGRFDIETLTRRSAAVVVGVPKRSLGTRLAPGGQLVLTDYEVSVLEVVKGAGVGGVIKVALVGGRLEFEDGTSTEVRTPKFEHVKAGRTYTFFLSEDESIPGLFMLTGGPQGLAEIVEGRSVKSHGRPTDPIAEESKDMGKGAFLREVRKRGKEWPEPGKCCR